MAFERPSLTELIERTEGDIKSTIGLDLLLDRSFLKAFARALAGMSHSLHAHITFISRQIFPDQAEAEILDRWGSIFGLERNAATFSQHTMTFTFTGAGTVPAGTIFKRTDGLEYELDADVDALAAGTETGVVSASVTGSDSNLQIGDELSFEAPLAFVDSNIVVDSVVTEGEDAETDEDYRIRLVERIQQPPAGGTVADYISFMKSVTGVTRGWVFPGYLGEGSVGCSFVEDGEDPIIPDAAKVDEVQAAVDLQKPVSAKALVFAPIDNPVDFNISITPNTAAVRSAVTAELQDLFNREAQVKGAIREVGTGLEYTGKIPLSRINEAISIAQGEEDHVVNTPAIDPEPATDGGILTLGTITWQTLA